MNTPFPFKTGREELPAVASRMREAARSLSRNIAWQVVMSHEALQPVRQDRDVCQFRSRLSPKGFTAVAPNGTELFSVPHKVLVTALGL